MDPPERILPDKDTTFVFLLEAQARRHEMYHLTAADLFVRGREPWGRCRRVTVRRTAPHWDLAAAEDLPLGHFQVIFMRSDPPVDLLYVFATLILSLVDPRGTLVINDPHALREANEKLYILNFPDLVPESLVSSDPERLKSFLDEVGGEMVVKPLEGCGGQEVFYLQRGDRNLNAILEATTREGRRLLMAQRYLPAVRDGDKRVIVLDGEPIGAVMRIPREDEARGNIHVGGRCEKTTLSARDREICARIAPRLRQDGLHFVGLDLIGGYLTEANVTSPTGVQEINRLDGVRLERHVLDFVERRAPRSDG